MSTIPSGRWPQGDAALIGAARELLVIQREHEEGAARSRRLVIAAARSAGLRWHEIGAALGQNPVSVRSAYHRERQAGRAS